jgi:hypothetical protein
MIIEDRLVLGEGVIQAFRRPIVEQEIFGDEGHRGSGSKRNAT